MKHRIALRLLLILGTLLLSGGFLRQGEAQWASSPWPMFGHDPQHTGQSEFANPETNNLKWSYEVPARYEPVIGAEGTIYITANGALHAVNPDGTVKWIYDASPDVIVESPAIGPDGTIYAPGSDVPFSNGFLFVLNPDGSLKWKSRYTGLYWQGLLTIGNDGTIYTAAGACGENYEYYAINPDGSLRWTLVNGYGCTGVAAPAIGPDGTIYAPTGGLTALDPIDGQPKWRLPLSFLCSPAIGQDGTIYLNAGDLYAVNPDGTIKWIVPDAGYWNNWSQSPAIGSDGTIYSAGIGYRFYAINPDGTIKWTKDGLGSEAHVALSSDGILYFAGFGYWGAISAVNGELIWTFTPPQADYADAFASPAIGPDGTAYFSAPSGLFAFGSVPPPPMHQNAKNLRPPFRGSQWKKSQLFADYLTTYGTRTYNGYHSGEDWVFTGKKRPEQVRVCTIGVGRIAHTTSLGSLGYLVAIEHTGPFTIPGRTETVHGETYQYPTENVQKIYSVYMHITPKEGLTPGQWLKAGEEIGTLTPSNAYLSVPHVHFEIRHPTQVPSGNWSLVGDPGNWQVFPGTDILNGYYIYVQPMIDGGVRHPSDLLEANK